MRTNHNRRWDEYPLGTKAHSIMGGHWVRVQNGWKWHCGSTFPTPGGEAVGQCIELPPEETKMKASELEIKYLDCCLPDYFQGYSGKVYAVQVYKELAREQLIEDMIDEYNMDDDDEFNLSTEQMRVLCEEFVLNDKPFDHLESGNLDDSDWTDSVYLYFTIGEK